MESWLRSLGGEPEAFSSSPTGPLIVRHPLRAAHARSSHLPPRQSRLDKFCFPGGPAARRGKKRVPEMAAALVCRVWVWRQEWVARPEASPASRLALWLLSGPSARLSPPPTSTLSCLPEPSWNSRGGQAEADPAPHERWGPCACVVSGPIFDTPHSACLARGKRSINIW